MSVAPSGFKPKSGDSRAFVGSPHRTSFLSRNKPLVETARAAVLTGWGQVQDLALVIKYCPLLHFALSSFTDTAFFTN